MEMESDSRIEELFHELLSVEPVQRAKRLERVRREDPTLADEVESLLAAHDSDSPILAERSEDSGARAEPPLRSIFRKSRALAHGEAEPETLFAPLFASLRSHADSFARYEMRGEIGRGGMGVVKRAWDGELERDVAMKVLGSRSSVRPATPPADTQALGRFFKEAKVTGFLDHPGIVPVHELGLDDHGGVYFTMRLVEGRELGKIFELARAGAEGWSLTRAIGVLLKVAEALSFAHAKGVVHRDIKPSNVMVGRFGEVYVMDWGIAALENSEDPHDLRVRETPPNPADRVGDGLVTEDGQVLGTPVYMSPEQARGETRLIGPRTDIYAFGAMLYQLLSGQTPYASKDKRLSPVAILHRVRNGPPEPAHELDPTASPELEAICAKAMAREIDSRYASMQALAEDLQAWLDGRVVRAYESGARAELKKWITRNRSLAASALAAVVFAFAGLGSTAYVQAQARAQEVDANRTLSGANAQLAQANVDLTRSREEALANARQAEEEALEARRQRATADHVADFLVELFRSPEPFYAKGAVVTAEDLLRRGTQEINAVQKQDPILRARLLDAMGEAYDRLGQYPAAQPLLEEALAIRSRELGDAHPDTLSSLYALASLCYGMGRLDEAGRLYQQVLDGRRKLFGDADESVITTMVGQAELLRDQGRYAEAEAILRKAIPAAEQISEEGPAFMLMLKNHLALTLEAQGELEQAGAIYEEVLAVRRTLFGPDHIMTLNVMNNFAGLLQRQGKFDAALPLLRDALATSERIYPADHPALLSAMNNMGALFLALRRFGDAEGILVRCLEGERRALPADHPHTLDTQGNLAYCYDQLGRHAEASEMSQQVYESTLRTRGEDHPSTWMTMIALADKYTSEERFEEAEPLYVTGLERMRKGLGKDHPNTLSALNNLAFMYMSMKRWDDAAPLMEQALEGLRVKLGDEHPNTQETQQSLAAIYIEQGRLQEAEALVRDLLARIAADSLYRKNCERMLERIKRQHH